MSRRAEYNKRKNEYNKEWRKRNPDKVRLTNAMNLIKYYSMTKEERSEHNKKRDRNRSPESRAKYLMWHREYQWKKRGIKGLSNEVYEKALKEQNNKCKICNEDMKKPHSDHNHKTGKFRALLCAGCNLAYGRYEKFKKGFKKYDLL